MLTVPVTLTEKSFGLNDATPVTLEVARGGAYVTAPVYPLKLLTTLDDETVPTIAPLAFTTVVPLTENPSVESNCVPAISYLI